MLTLTKRAIKKPEPTGNAALDAVLTATYDNEVARAAEHEAIAAEVNRVGGTEAELTRKLEDAEKRHDALASALRDLAVKFNAHDVRMPMDAAERKRFRMGQVIRALSAGADHGDLSATRGWDRAGAGYEREVLQQVEKNHAAQSAQVRATMGPILEKSAGILIHSEAIADWIDILRAKLVLPKMGARVLTNLQGMEVPIYGLATGVSSAWYAIGAEPEFSVQTMKARYLSPHRLATAAKINKLLLDQASVDVQAMVEDDMAQSVASAMETAALFGTGVSGQPRGLVNDPDVLTLALGTNGARFGLRDVPLFEKTMEEANVDITDDAGFVFGPGPKAQLKREGVANYSTQAISAGTPFVIPGVSDAALEALLGYRFASSTRVPTGLTKGSSTGLCTYVLFALWKQLMIGQWGGMVVRMSEETGNSTGSAFLRNERWVVTEMLADAMLRQPKAAVVCADALTAE